jgi:hypothetical protein
MKILDKKAGFYQCASFVAAIAFAVPNFAMAQTAAPAEQKITIKRVPGIITGGTIDKITYKPNCQKFVFDISASSIQEATSRAFVLEQEAKFNKIRDRWTEYEDCIIENARLDVAGLNEQLSNYIQAASKTEVENFTATNAAANAAVERLKNAKKKVKAVGFVPHPWTMPAAGRVVGSLTSGSAKEVVYTSGCGLYTGEVTVEDFAKVESPDDFNKMVEVVKSGPDKIQKTIDCRNTNVQDDFTVISKKIEDGLNEVYLPERTAFEENYSKVRTQINLQRQAGGLLAGSGSKAGAKKPTKKK